MAPVNKRRAFLRRDSGAPRSALEKFAQVGKSTYDPRLRREKERALNAKTVNKYRKIQKRVQQEWEDTGVVPQVRGGGMVLGVGMSFVFWNECGLLFCQ